MTVPLASSCAFGFCCFGHIQSQLHNDIPKYFSNKSKQHSPFIISSSPLHNSLYNNVPTSFFFPVQQLSVGDEVLGSGDVIVGTGLAFALAFLASFLQGNTPSSSDIILWRREENKNKDKTFIIDTGKTVVNNNATLGIDKDDGNNVEKSEEGCTTGKGIIFDSKDWKEMSRPENYVLYNTRVRKKLRPLTGSFEKISPIIPLKNILKNKSSSSSSSSPSVKNKSPTTPSSRIRKEQRWVLIGLLLLFVPIFSAEFFFTLSRQFACGNGPEAIAADWAKDFCAPAKY